MVFLWGIPSDRPLRSVDRALDELGVPVAFVDQRNVLDTEVELTAGTTLEGRIRIGAESVDLNQITAAYPRPYDSRRLPQIRNAGENSPEWRHAVRIEGLLAIWLELTPALVINRLSAMASNTSKPYQASLIQAHGFAVPDTLVTTDPEAVREFHREHRDVIYKSVSSVRSIVSRLKADQLEDLSDVASCPTQFQQYIDGNDYRVHVVEDEVFACEIVSEADDYRYASSQGAEAVFRPFGLPDECAQRCRKLARELHLTLAGIDLRHGKDGIWYCFEVNPSPGFSAFEETGSPAIARAVARRLARTVPVCAAA